MVTVSITSCDSPPSSPCLSLISSHTFSPFLTNTKSCGHESRHGRARNFYHFTAPYPRAGGRPKTHTGGGPSAARPGSRGPSRPARRDAAEPFKRQECADAALRAAVSRNAIRGPRMRPGFDCARQQSHGFDSEVSVRRPGPSGRLSCSGCWDKHMDSLTRAMCGVGFRAGQWMTRRLSGVLDCPTCARYNSSSAATYLPPSLSQP